MIWSPTQSSIWSSLILPLFFIFRNLLYSSCVRSVGYSYLCWPAIFTTISVKSCSNWLYFFNLTAFTSCFCSTFMLVFCGETKDSIGCWRDWNENYWGDSWTSREFLGCSDKRGCSIDGSTVGDQPCGDGKSTNSEVILATGEGAETFWFRPGDTIALIVSLVSVSICNRFWLSRVFMMSCTCLLTAVAGWTGSS